MGFLICIFIIVATIAWYRRRHRYDIPRSFHQDIEYREPEESEYDLGGYVKKQFIFDTVSEFNFLPLLQDILGPNYYVFPQINYSHLIQARTGSYFEDRRHRSHIERKSADFVVCDKKACIPRLVINLDGAVHNKPEVHMKDMEIDEILDTIGLPILRLKNEESRDRELVKTRVNTLLK